jgi:hypothetical protein
MIPRNYIDLTGEAQEEVGRVCFFMIPRTQKPRKGKGKMKRREYLNMTKGE